MRKLKFFSMALIGVILPNVLLAQVMPTNPVDQWQYAVIRQNCPSPPFNVYNPLTAGDIQAPGAVHITAFPADCGAGAPSMYRWTNYVLPLNLCVNNNFTFSFRLRNSQSNNLGGELYSDISVEVGGPNNWRAGATFSSSQAGNNNSQYCYGWAGLWAAQVNPPLAANNPYMPVDDGLYHTITLAYNNGVLIVSRDGNQVGAAIQANVAQTVCTINFLRIQFKGNGWIDWVSGTTSTGLNWLESFNNGIQPNPLTANCPVLGMMGISVQQPTCLNNTLTLTANGSLPSSPAFSWTGPNGQTSTANPLVINNPTSAVNGAWGVTATGGCLSNSASEDVLLIPPSNGPAQTHQATSCAGDTIQLQASGGTSYSWTQLGGGPGSISGGNTATPFVWPSSSTTYLATITSGACTRVDTFRVTTSDCHCEDSCSWSLTGNLNVKARNFIGSINNADFKIRTNNVQRAIVTAAGNVGIGTATPGARLEVNSQTPNVTGLRITQPLTATASNGTVLTVDPSTGNVILAADQAGGGGNPGWELHGNDVRTECDDEYIGTNNSSDLRFRTDSKHWMRLTGRGSLSIEPVCNANSASMSTNLMTGTGITIEEGQYNAVSGESNTLSNTYRSLVAGSGHSISSRGSQVQNLFVTGAGNNYSDGRNSVMMGSGLTSQGSTNFHLGSGRLVNQYSNSFMLGWSRRHTLIANQDGLAIKTATSGTPDRAAEDLATARLDVQAAAFYSELWRGELYPSGVRFRNLPANRGRHLVVDDKGYVYVEGDPSEEGPTPPPEDLDKLRKEVAELKQQVQLLMKALQTPAVQPSASTLEIVPTPFDKMARAQYSIENFSGNAVLQVADAAGRVLRSYPVRAAKGSIELGNISTPDGVLFFSIVDSGRMVISVRSIKQGR